MELHRKELGLLIQLCTGHNYLNYHQHLVYQELEDDLCRLCLEDTEDSWHLLAECPVLGRIRREVMGYEIFVHNVHALPWEPKLFLTLLRGEPMKLLVPKGRVIIG